MATRKKPVQVEQEKQGVMLTTKTFLGLVGAAIGVIVGLATVANFLLSTQFASQEQVSLLSGDYALHVADNTHQFAMTKRDKSELSDKMVNLQQSVEDVKAEQKVLNENLIKLMLKFDVKPQKLPE